MGIKNNKLERAGLYIPELFSKNIKDLTAAAFLSFLYEKKALYRQQEKFCVYLNDFKERYGVRDKKLKTAIEKLAALGVIDVETTKYRKKFFKINIPVVSTWDDYEIKENPEYLENSVYRQEIAEKARDYPY